MEHNSSITKAIRPREKILQVGARNMSLSELLQLILGSGSKYNRIDKITAAITPYLEQYHPEALLEQLQSIDGIGPAKAAQVIAAVELGHRYYLEKQAALLLNSTNKVAAVLMDLTIHKQEHLAILSVNGAYELLNRHTVSIGTLNEALVHPREIFAPAIRDSAAGIYIGHNHPSNNPLPSTPDITATKRLSQAGQILGVKLIDHIIVTTLSGYYSLAEHGQL